MRNFLHNMSGCYLAATHIFSVIRTKENHEEVYARNYYCNIMSYGKWM